MPHKKSCLIFPIALWDRRYAELASNFLLPSLVGADAFGSVVKEFDCRFVFFVASGIEARIRACPAFKHISESSEVIFEDIEGVLASHRTSTANDIYQQTIKRAIFLVGKKAGYLVLLKSHFLLSRNVLSAIQSVCRAQLEALYIAPLRVLSDTYVANALPMISGADKISMEAEDMARLAWDNLHPSTLGAHIDCLTMDVGAPEGHVRAGCGGWVSNTWEPHPLVLRLPNSIEFIEVNTWKRFEEFCQGSVDKTKYIQHSSEAFIVSINGLSSWRHALGPNALGKREEQSAEYITRNPERLKFVRFFEQRVITHFGGTPAEWEHATSVASDFVYGTLNVIRKKTPDRLDQSFMKKLVSSLFVAYFSIVKDATPDQESELIIRRESLSGAFWKTLMFGFKAIFWVLKITRLQYILRVLASKSVRVFLWRKSA